MVRHIMRGWVTRSIIALLAVTPGFADSVVFLHEGSLYHSITDGKQPGLFVYGKSKPKGTSDFLPPKRIGDAVQGLMVAVSDGKMRFASPGCEHTLDVEKGIVQKRKIQLPLSPPAPCLWTLADYNGDGHTDVIVFSQTTADAKARISYGRADGTYAPPFVLQADGKDFDSSGIRSPHFVNLDDDDDLDLIHLDAQGGMIYYENSNTNSEPLYAVGRVLPGGTEKTVIDAVCPFDWNADGHTDLIIMTRDGAIGYLPHRGLYQNGLPIFSALVSLIASPTSP